MNPFYHMPDMAIEPGRPSMLRTQGWNLERRHLGPRSQPPGSAVATEAPAARYMDTVETAPTNAVQSSGAKPETPSPLHPKENKSMRVSYV